MLIIGVGPKKKGPKDMNPMEKYLSKGEGKEPLMEAEGSRNGEINFSMPAGFKVPDGVKDGEPFDAMATLMVKGGRLVLGELDGTPVSDEPEMEAPEAEEPEAETSEEVVAPESSEDDESEEPSEEDDENEADEADDNLDFLSSIEKKVSKKKKKM
jgi:TATA-binding protein-associated factor Taf7